ncbi:MAG: hypothetical protein U0231_00490 [Nitrospiraceae bacterium]
MRVELKKLQQRLRATMVYVTHDQVEAMTLGDQIVVLEGGHVRQVDPPDRLYGEPANPFVASFIGTPAMNLWEGQIVETSGQSVFRTEGFEIPLPAGLHIHKGLQGSSATLGIRPEDIVMEPSAGALALETTIELIEDLGADLLLHGRIGPGDLGSHRPPHSNRIGPSGAPLRADCQTASVSRKPPCPVNTVSS